MRKHKVTLIETTNLNDIREGDIYIKVDGDGLIREMAKRRNGKMVSMLYSEPIQEVGIKETPKPRKRTVKEIPASEDTIKPLKIE